MKAILIEPTNRQLIELDLADDTYFEQMQDVIGGNLDRIQLSRDVDIWVHDEGLMRLEYEGDQCTSHFFVLHSQGRPYNLIVGNAIIIGFARENSVSLKSWQTTDLFKQYIRFVPDEQRNTAARLAEELLGLCGPVSTPEELEALRAQHTAILTQAMEIATITHVSSPSANPPAAAAESAGIH